MVQGHRGYVVQQDLHPGLPPHRTHTSRQCVGVFEWGENTIPDPCFSLIGCLDSQWISFNGARRPLGHTGTLSAPLRGRPLCGARPHPDHALTQSSGFSTGWGGDWGQTPWAHPLVLHASRHPALLLLLPFICVVEWGCF